MVNKDGISQLIQKAKAKIAKLPLKKLQTAGIWRDNHRYFLNIAYPSLQIMSNVSPTKIFSAASNKSGKKVALYIHIPFCTAECFYCHYYKQFKRPAVEVDLYLDSVEQEITIYKKLLGGLSAASIYIGGGTPSYMTSSQIDRLFTLIKKHVQISQNIEISFEMHPESITQDRLDILKSYGVNRINIGVESFNDRILKSENRRHDSQAAIQAYNKIKRTGFTNINVDLIYGLMNQTVAMWEDDLNKLGSLKPPSATLYYLRLKRGTPEYNLWKSFPGRFPDEKDMLLMHVMNFEFMEGELGYTQKPVDWFIQNPSIFHQYQDHNWRRSDETVLLGIGPSAYSYIDGWQYYNINDTAKYQKL